MGQPRLTVCILAKNEEQNIGRALESVVRLADEIIVVDTGSTDRTVEIAASFGARIVHHPWNDSFADARNAGLEHATGDWVLMLDADEAVSKSMAEGLPRALRDGSADAYMTIMTNYREGRPLDRSAVVRLFRNRPLYRYVGRIHESVMGSILKQGGEIKTLRLVIEHYGYTAGEDDRKGRRERNVRLLETSLQEDDSQADKWFYLGQEYIQARELGRAAHCLRRALELDPGDMRIVHAAHSLASIALLRYRIDDAWDLARMGRDHEVTRWDSLMRTAQVALFEGDYVTTADALAQLKGASPDDFGKIARDPAELENMAAQGLWEQGRRAEALQRWEEAVRAYPSNQPLAVQWVRHRTLVDGLRSGTLGSLQKINTPQVTSGAVGALLRAGEYDLAANLSESTLERGFLSPFTLYGLVRAGRANEAATLALGQGLNGATQLATGALWFGADAALSQALDHLSGAWRNAFECVIAQKVVAEADLWALDSLTVMWAEAGCLNLLDAAAACLSPEAGVGKARIAWLLYQKEQAVPAVERALQVPEHPDAQEVLGLVSADHGDWQAAAQFLVERIMAGPAAVRVYHRAAQALVRIGRRQEAQEVLDLGVSQRPHATLLKRDLPS